MNIGDLVNVVGDFNAYISIELVIILFSIGFIIKHTPALNKVPNDTIPCIVIIIGVLFSLAAYGMTLSAAVTGITSALVATGVHQLGKTTSSIATSKKEGE